MNHTWKRFDLMSLAVVLLAMVCAPVGAEASRWVNLGTANTSSGLTVYNGSDGQNSAVIQGGVDCRRNDSGSRYFYFGVNDSWAYQGSRKSVCVAIRYYDNSTNTITLQYDSIDDGAIKNAVAMPRMNTNTWKTFLWHIEDAYFGNRQNLGADFRIMSANTAYIDMVYVSEERGVDIDLGASDAANGLVRNHYAPDGATAAAAQGGVDCRSNQAGSNYFYFGVDDGWASAGSRRDLYVTVEYFDNGTSSLTLQYDSTQDGSYREARSFRRTNTNTWKTRKWYIKDAYFGNRQNAVSDFRIHGPDTYYLNKVYVWEGHKALMDLGATNACKGLTSASANDGVTSSAMIGGLDCRTLASGSHYFYMKVDDAFAYKGNRQDVYITAHYYDRGTGSFRLEYDGLTTKNMVTASIYRTNTNTWKSHTWHVADAYFGNRQNGQADFRIQSPGTIDLDLVYVRDFQLSLTQKGMAPRVTGADSVSDPKPFRDLMTSAALCPNTWATVGSIEMYQGRIADHTNAELQGYVEDAQSWQKQFCLSAWPLKQGSSMDTGLASFNSRKAHSDRIIGVGGTIDEFSMDEPLSSVVDVNRINKDAEYAMVETATWIGLTRNRYPNTRIGSIEPFAKFSVSDLQSWVSGLNDHCAMIGVEGIDFFVMDPNWGAFSPPHNQGSWIEAKEIRDYCKGINLPFTMIYWASGVGASTTSSTDVDWYNAVMQQGAECLAANINPDRYLVENWTWIPALTVPETAEWSFTKSVLDMLSAYCGFEPPNGSFELPDVSTWQLTTPTSWSTTGQIAVIQSGNSSWGGMASSKGSQHIGLQGASSISQAISGLVVGATYSISWAEANLPNSGGSIYRVSIDSTIIGPLHTVTGTSWVPCESDTFMATSPMMTLKFEALSPTGTVFLDAVMVKIGAGAAAEPVPTPTPSPTPNPNSWVRRWADY